VDQGIAGYAEQRQPAPSRRRLHRPDLEPVGGPEQQDQAGRLERQGRQLTALSRR
jgi:hypothetical protein